MSTTERRPVLVVVDDEPSYRDALFSGLTHEGFEVHVAGDLTSARALVDQVRPDLVLLDVMLPDGSGIDYCREITLHSRTPVIMVSARTSELDIVLGLEIGAADYVTKPFRLREFVARIRAVLRRPPTDDATDVIAFGDVRIDVERRIVTRHARALELSRKEFDLLVLLASRAGQVVTREQCLDSLWWGLELNDSRTLDTHVKRLRHKIEDDPSIPRHLITIRGVGFRLDF